MVSYTNFLFLFPKSALVPLYILLLIIPNFTCLCDKIMQKILDEGTISCSLLKIVLTWASRDRKTLIIIRNGLGSLPQTLPPRGEKWCQQKL